MIRLLLTRKYSQDQTLGRLFVFSGITLPPVFECATLELPWKDNQKNISCIPEGVYPCRKMKSQTFGNIIAVDDVPDRSLIRIHQANFTSELRGCIAPGRLHTFINEDNLYDVSYSKATLQKILMHLPGEFEMKIISI